VSPRISAENNASA
jgi:hypothetical protein